MDYVYHTLDVFTDTPFAGNPLAVFPEADGLSDERMQAIAKELNLSETVFVFPPSAGGSRRVRIMDAGHLVPAEKPGEVNQAIMDFLDETEL